LNADHPAITEIRTVLSDLAGEPVRGPIGNGAGIVNPNSPLGRYGPKVFRLLLIMIQAGAPIDEESIRRRAPDAWPDTIRDGLVQLVDDGILEEGVGRVFALSPRVPESFKTLVLRLAELIGDPRFEAKDVIGSRAMANQFAADGAPRLFGTDARLRNMMALALHGPMLYRDLRKITGAAHLAQEAKDFAPFGRAALVRLWETDDGPAVALDGAHPLALPLKRLLLRLAEIYPPSPHVPAFDAPAMPPAHVWRGDKLAFFGDNIPTNVLFSIGVYGWTFEALCVHFAGLHRENIKLAMMRLEEEGVLQGDRPRRPGANVRVVTVCDTFPAKAELEDLLRVGARVWKYDETVRKAFDLGLKSKTKAHLVKRGLLPDGLTPPPLPNKKKKRLEPKTPKKPRRPATAAEIEALYHGPPSARAAIQEDPRQFTDQVLRPLSKRRT
jgi:hypothetical protein